MVRQWTLTPSFSGSNPDTPAMYLPDEIKDKVYYEPRDNKFEKSAEDFYNKIKSMK